MNCFLSAGKVYGKSEMYVLHLLDIVSSPGVTYLL